MAEPSVRASPNRVCGTVWGWPEVPRGVSWRHGPPLGYWRGAVRPPRGPARPTVAARERAAVRARFLGLRTVWPVEDRARLRLGSLAASGVATQARAEAQRARAAGLQRAA